MSESQKAATNGANEHELRQQAEYIFSFDQWLGTTAVYKM